MNLFSTLLNYWSYSEVIGRLWCRRIWTEHNCFHLRLKLSQVCVCVCVWDVSWELLDVRVCFEALELNEASREETDPLSRLLDSSGWSTSLDANIHISLILSWLRKTKKTTSVLLVSRERWPPHVILQDVWINMISVQMFYKGNLQRFTLNFLLWCH